MTKQCPIAAVLLFFLLTSPISARAEVILFTGPDGIRTNCGDAVTTQAQERLDDLIGPDGKAFWEFIHALHAMNENEPIPEGTMEYLYEVSMFGSFGVRNSDTIIGCAYPVAPQLACEGSEALTTLLRRIDDSQDYIAKRWWSAKGEGRIYAARVVMEAVRIQQKRVGWELNHAFQDAKELMMNRCIRTDKPRDYYYLSWARKLPSDPLLFMQEVAEQHDWFVMACTDDDSAVRQLAGDLILTYFATYQLYKGSCPHLGEEDLQNLKAALKYYLIQEQDLVKSASLALEGEFTKDDLLEFSQLLADPTQSPEHIRFYWYAIEQIDKE